MQILFVIFQNLDTDTNIFQKYPDTDTDTLKVSGVVVDCLYLRRHLF